MSSEQYSGGLQAEEENTKPSFMNKIKSKAKKLKSKLKPHDSEDSSGQAPPPRDPLDHYTTGTADQDGDESDTSSNSDETGNQHASEGTTFGGVSSGKAGYGTDSKTDDKSFPVDPSVLKSDGPPGTQQAVPTNYSYFNPDPEQSGLPSNTEASGRQRGVPSTGGGSSAGLTSASPFANRDDTLSKSGDRDSELPLSSISPVDSADRNNVGSVEPSQRSQDSLLSHPIEQDQGVSDKDHEGYGGLAAAATTAAGAGGIAAGVGHKFQKSLSNDSSKKLGSGMRSSSDPEAHDRSYTGPESEGLAPDATGVAAGVKNVTETNSDVPSQELTWTQKLYNTVVGAKDTVASHPVTQSVASHPVTQKATETAYGVKDTAASTLGYGDPAVSTDSSPVAEKVTDSAVQAKDSAAANLPTNDEQKPVMDRVTDSAYGIKDAVASHPVTQAAASKLGYADQGLSTDSTPVSQKVTDSSYQAKDSAASNLSSNDGVQKPFTDRLTESAYGVKDAVVSHPVTQTAASKLGYADQGLSTDSTPVSQKVTDSSYQAKDSAASNLSSNDGVQKPFTDRLTESAYGVKDAVVSHPITQTAASKLGYADQALSTDSTPVSQKGIDSSYQVKDSAASNLSANDGEQKPFTDRVTESAYGVKDAVVSHPVTQTAASKLGYADQALSSDSTPVSQKATDSSYQVKDSASSNLSANDGVQKPLTDRVTDSAYGWKDTVASHPVTQKAYDLKNAVVSHPVTQQATEYAVQGKNYGVNQFRYADQALSSDDKPVSAKTYEAAVQKTAPDHHDKALADSVTDSISSLPALLTSKLGLGGGATTGSPTSASTTPTADASTFDSSTRKDTPFPNHPGAASPGIMDRVSGLASSLFGGGAKHPDAHTEAEKPATAEKYIP